MLSPLIALEAFGSLSIVIDEEASVLLEETREYKIIEKALEALEIIKKKKVDVNLLSLSQNVIVYNNMMESEDRKLTNNEYISVKEALWKNYLNTK